MFGKTLVILTISVLLSGSALAEDAKNPGFDATARQKPMPVISELDDSIGDETWVTMVYEVDNGKAAFFVPILRPLVPKNGHLVAHPESNSLLITDSYANLQKLIEIVRLMDAATPRQPQD